MRGFSTSCFEAHLPIILGKHTLQSRYALAPMAGLTDVPMRTLAWRYGAGYMVSEMVSSKPELWETGKSRLRRVPVPAAKPIAVQLAGTEPHILAEAARRHEGEGVEVIDLNFGCPAKKVCRKSAGSALLADLDRIARIIDAVTHAVTVPVTMKTRTGLVPGDELGLLAAQIGEQAGVAMIVVHARSRACRFVGEVDYKSVQRVKAAVQVPVLVNGDIDSVAGAKYALAQTEADGVMIGRGAFGRPWIFAELSGAGVPDRNECWRVIDEHLTLMHDFYGERAGVRIARKHVLAYAENMGFATTGFAGSQLAQIDDADSQLDWLQRARQNDEDPKQSNLKSPKPRKAA